jgi:AcrR family transcriptional regulator
LQKTNGRAYVWSVRKGEQTREAILGRALTLASRVGLDGLTIGTLAGELEISKSGLFAHFRSKEALVVQLLERAAERYREVVIAPALAAPRGEPRVRKLFELGLRWPELVPQPGGCIFITASVELDDRPGPARDLLVRFLKEKLEFLAGAVRRAVEAGHFHAKVDPEQFAFEMEAIGRMWHESSRLMRDPRADERAHRAFEALVATARKPRR